MKLQKKKYLRLILPWTISFTKIFGSNLKPIKPVPEHPRN